MSDALKLYAAAAAAMAVGVSVAAAHFPGGFDWAYTVISKLGSRAHNPAGAVWLCGSLLLSALLLWRAVGLLRRAELGERPPGSLRVLRFGLFGAALLALEGLFGLDLSGMVRKGHELVALATLVAFYVGVLGLYVRRVRQDAPFLWPALLVLLPLVAVGVSQLILYFDQRDLGWVNTGWRELGVPIWLSFAFWQWTAVAVLGAGIGHLIATHGQARPATWTGDRRDRPPRRGMERRRS